MRQSLLRSARSHIATSGLGRAAIPIEDREAIGRHVLTITDSNKPVKENASTGELRQCLRTSDGIESRWRWIMAKTEAIQARVEAKLKAQVGTHPGRMLSSQKCGVGDETRHFSPDPDTFSPHYWDWEADALPKPVPGQASDDEQKHEGDQQREIQGPACLLELGFVVPVKGEPRDPELGVADRDSRRRSLRPPQAPFRGLADQVHREYGTIPIPGERCCNSPRIPA